MQLPPTTLPRISASRLGAPAPRAGASTRGGLLSAGFRPFYLCGAVAAVVVVPVWLAVFLGALPWPIETPLTPMLWHGHEMVFGFAAAVIVGFLFTAGERWTGLPMPKGWLLGAFVAAWVSARATALIGPYQLHAFIDTLLLPSVALVLAWRLVESRNFIHGPVVAILLALTGTDVVFHLGVMGVLHGVTVQPLHAAIALLVLLETIIGGRVIPAFHMAVCRGLVLRSRAAFDRVVALVSIAALAWWILAPQHGIAWMLCAMAALLHAARLLSWNPWAGRRLAMLWILSLSYAFIPLGFALLAVALATGGGDGAPVVSVAVAQHAFGAGATGGLILGMMCRSARGHTGRMIHASGTEVLAFALVLLGAVVRLVWPIACPAEATAGLILAGALWCGAFGVFLVRFTPWLVGPSDGGPVHSS